MSKRPPYVDWYASDFLAGIAGLGPVEIAVYTVVINLIYDKGGPISDDRPRIARRCGCRIDQFNKALDELIRLEKIISADGVLSNRRCEATITKRAQRIETYISNFKGGVHQSEEKDSKINGNAHPVAGASATSTGNSPPNPNLNSPSERPRRQPNRQPTPERAKVAAAKKGTRIDPSWQPANEQVLFARQQGLTDRETVHEARKFVAHYQRATGRYALSADWDASWQGWVLNAVERLGRHAAPPPAAGRAVDPSSYSREEWSRVIQVYGSTGNWNLRNGPAPGEPGCLCPKDLVRELVNHG